MPKSKSQMYNLLIIDDDPLVLETLASYLQGSKITARCIKPDSKDFITQTVDTARKYSIRAATIDYDLGNDFSGGRFTGNQVGKALQESCPDICLAGITGGKAADFDANLFAIREHKSAVTQDSYKALCDLLLNAKKPRQDYTIWKQSNQGLTEIFAAMYVLAQGYTISKRVQLGEQPIPGKTLRVCSDQELNSLISMIAEPEFAVARTTVSDDQELAELMHSIETKTQVNPASVLKLEQRLKTILEEKSRGS